MFDQLLKKSPPVTVAPAKHGQGVFAAKRFRAGQEIGEIKGKLINDPDYGSNYCIDVGNPYSLEPDAPYRFLNHSCDPNSKLFVVSNDDEPADQIKVVIEALKNIQPGTEITIDYEWDADAAIRCGCGADNCRGWVVSLAELHIVGKYAD